MTSKLMLQLWSYLAVAWAVAFPWCWYDGRFLLLAAGIATNQAYWAWRWSRDVWTQRYPRKRRAET